MTAASFVELQVSRSFAVTVSSYFVTGQVATNSTFTAGLQNIALSGTTPVVNLPAGDYFRYGVAALVTNNANPLYATDATQPPNLGLASAVYSVLSTDTNATTLAPLLGMYRGTVGNNTPDYSSTAVLSSLATFSDAGDVQSNSGSVGAYNQIYMFDYNFGTPPDPSTPDGYNRLTFGGISANAGQPSTIFNNLAFKAVGTGSVAFQAYLYSTSSSHWGESGGNYETDLFTHSDTVNTAFLTVNVGKIDALPGTTLSIGGASSLAWLGGTYSAVDTGTLAISQTTGPVMVTAGSALNIASNSTVVVGGSSDPFTDTTTTTNHIAIVNSGSLTLKSSTTLAGIAGSGKLVIGDGTTANKVTLATNSGLSTLNSLQINGTSSLDIANNHVVVQFTTDPRSTILAYLHAGDFGGNWSGTGIVSSAAAASNGNYGIGYADGADHLNPSLTSGQLEIAYALNGDITLQGYVNATDFGILASNFGKSVTGGWAQGDLNYDGVINATDFSLLTSNFGKSASGAAVALPSADWAALDSFASSQGLLADVPEPASAGILLMSCLGILSRRVSRRAPML